VVVVLLGLVLVLVLVLVVLVVVLVYNSVEGSTTAAVTDTTLRDSMADSRSACAVLIAFKLPLSDKTSARWESTSVFQFLWIVVIFKHITNP
jgi:hypothetical protein